jgi:hypothetical protein
MSDHLAALLTANAVGVLQRDVSVVMMNISRSGCLLDSPVAISVGTLAMLAVEMDGLVYSDEIRVARCRTVPGAGERHHIGVSFVVLHPPGRRSLRLFAAGLNATGREGDPLGDWIPSSPDS